EIKLGSRAWVCGINKPEKETGVYLSVNGKYLGRFGFHNHYRDALPALIKKLQPHYKLSVLSGDNDAERDNLFALMGRGAEIRFHQKPEDKLEYIEELQHRGDHVMMIGD